MLAITFTITGWAVFLFWVITLIFFFYFRKRKSIISWEEKLADLQHWPKVSVIVPAKNEGKKIKACLTSLLELDYPDVQIIAVDDRSEDTTGEIMDGLAETSTNLEIIHVKELPEDWLGKNHAFHIASKSAEGKYILFTDGDIVFTEKSIKNAIKYAEHKNLDHFCFLPGPIPGGFFENTLATFFGLVGVQAILPALLRPSSKNFYYGIGAFNLVRKETYEKMGGQEKLRMEVVEDVMLGRLIINSEGKRDILSSDGQIKVRWQEGFWGIVKGIEKNAFALIDYSLLRLLALTIYLVLFFLSPFVVVFFIEAGYLWSFVSAGLIMLFTFVYLCFLSGTNPLSVIIFPILPLALLYANYRSAYITLKHKGVSWRDTFYPLDKLRKYRQSLLD